MGREWYGKVEWMKTIMTRWEVGVGVGQDVKVVSKYF